MSCRSAICGITIGSLVFLQEKTSGGAMSPVVPKYNCLFKETPFGPRQLLQKNYKLEISRLGTA